MELEVHLLLNLLSICTNASEALMEV